MDANSHVKGGQCCACVLCLILPPGNEPPPAGSTFFLRISIIQPFFHTPPCDLGVYSRAFEKIIEMEEVEDEEVQSS